MLVIHRKYAVPWSEMCAPKRSNVTNPLRPVKENSNETAQIQAKLITQPQIEKDQYPLLFLNIYFNITNHH